MRSDMSRVLTERPRVGGHAAKIRTRLRMRAADWQDVDDDPPPPPKRPRETKILTDHLRPLARLLQRAVGRPWNAVYAEIRREVDARSTAGVHLLRHVEQLVTREIFLVDGVPHALYDGKAYVGLYVHPRTHRLCHQPKPRRTATASASTPVTRVQWRERLWFQLVVTRRRASCGCVAFRDASMPDAPYWPITGDRASRRVVCIHGNAPEPVPTWHVVEYDHDEQELRRKVANSKELRALRRLA